MIATIANTDTIFTLGRSRSFRRCLFGVQLEIDFYVVMLTVAEAVWRRVNFRHSFRNRRERFIHDHVFGRLNHFVAGKTLNTLAASLCDLVSNLYQGYLDRRR
jgi:hypothetical protein